MPRRRGRHTERQAQLQRLPLHHLDAERRHLQQSVAQHNVGLHLQQRMAAFDRLHARMDPDSRHGFEHGLLPQRCAAQPSGNRRNVSQTLGIASLPLNQMPQISASTTAQDSASNNFGFSNIGADTNTNQVNITNTYTPFGTVTKTYGPHTFKVGASLRKNEFNSFNPATSPDRGSSRFDGSITNHGASGTPNTQIADFLLGKIKTTSYEQPQPPTGRRN